LSRQASPSAADIEEVAALLGRPPGGNFVIAVRRKGGGPVVIMNDPLLRDGTPMPTRYWLVDPELCSRVGRLEAAGGVKEVQRLVDPELIAEAHARYARDRDARLPVAWEKPRPSGGVGGTRQGVKCLHAHLAWWLAGGEDPVGQWVADRVGATLPVE
jgi:hypothetical protein